MLTVVACVAWPLSQDASAQGLSIGISLGKTKVEASLGSEGSSPITVTTETPTPLQGTLTNGSAVITKHDGTGGLVSRGTVTAQLLYEIDQPAYANPDVTAHFDTLSLSEEGPDRVRISGTRGSPARSADQ